MTRFYGSEPSAVADG